MFPNDYTGYGFVQKYHKSVVAYFSVLHIETYDVNLLYYLNTLLQWPFLHCKVFPLSLSILWEGTLRICIYFVIPKTFVY